LFFLPSFLLSLICCSHLDLDFPDRHFPCSHSFNVFFRIPLLLIPKMCRYKVILLFLIYV
jgi:hypothetical protein